MFSFYSNLTLTFELLTLPTSTSLQAMSMTLTSCSQVILQNSFRVVGRGPWEAMYASLLCTFYKTRGSENTLLFIYIKYTGIWLAENVGYKICKAKALQILRMTIFNWYSNQWKAIIWQNHYVSKFKICIHLKRIYTSYVVGLKFKLCNIIPPRIL